MQVDRKQKPAMEVRDLYFSYGKNKVLKGVSLKIAEGEITTILGANGCGKSTLFYLMTRNLIPRKGNIFLHGKNILNLGLKDFAKKCPLFISTTPPAMTSPWNGWYPSGGRLICG